VAPKDARGPYLLGAAFHTQGNVAEATRQYEAALALAPGFVDPLGQLANIALQNKQPDAALARVKRQIALQPNAAPLHYLLGSVHQARKEIPQAEGAYAKALELDPALIGAYVQLGSLYATAGRNERALAELDKAVKVNPKNIVPLMLIATIHHQANEVAKAKDAYRQVLAINARFAPAANNLAILESLDGGDKDKALQLAQVAKEAAPDNPYISDTLGWILYNRGVYERALGLLRESAAKLPDNAEVQYHLGMAYLKTGDKESARAALTKAARAPANFAGKDDAKRALAELN
jgi:tetratricopeptide (TPR) repeat protein